MSGRRWSLGLGSAIALMAIALVLSQLWPGAGAGGDSTAGPAGACGGAPPADGGGSQPVRGTWWRLVDRLDGGGSLVGRTLVAGIGGSTTLTLGLGAESMASGPVGGLVAVATDDGQSSEVRLVSAVEGCSWLVHRTGDVVRSAILDPSSGTVLAHVVARGTRNDRGTWRITGTDPAATLASVLGPLPPQPAIGPIWATTLRLDPAGKHLAVQSCGEGGCLTRVLSLDGSGGAAAIVTGPDQGSLIGFTGTKIVTWAFCQGLPCAVQAWEAGVDKPVTLVDQAAGAALTRDVRYLVAVLDGTGRAMRVDLAAASSQPIEGVAPGELPLDSGNGAAAGFEVRPDEVALGAAGADPHPFSPSSAALAP
jgi:hypothetical protein